MAKKWKPAEKMGLGAIFLFFRHFWAIFPLLLAEGRFPFLANFFAMGNLGVQSWSPFVTRKSGHIWRIWAEMTQTLMPKSAKVAQIHLPIRQVSAKIRLPPNFRQVSAKFPPKFAKLAKFRFTKGSNFEHPRRKNPTQKSEQKWERKWKMAPGLKWPKNGRRNGKIEAPK